MQSANNSQHAFILRATPYSAFTSPASRVITTGHCCVGPVHVCACVLTCTVHQPGCQGWVPPWQGVQQAAARQSHEPLHCQTASQPL